MQLPSFDITCFLQIDDCGETYDSFVSIPKSTNASSIDTIRGFFNAYLLHKHFIDYVVNLNINELVSKHWIYQANSHKLYGMILLLQSALNFNIQKLDLLVSYSIQHIARYFIEYYISLQLNTTCGACVSDCPKLTTQNAVIINAIEKCTSPLYSVIDTIASHSEKLFKTIKNLKHTVSNSEEDSHVVTNNVAQDVKDMCFCNAPSQETIQFKL